MNRLDFTQSAMRRSNRRSLRKKFRERLHKMNISEEDKVNILRLFNETIAEYLN